MFDVLVNGERRSFTKSKATIGRAADCDLVLAGMNISRRHAELALKNGTFVLVDLSSATGTFVNNRKIVGATTVERGDQIRIGDFALQVTLPGDAPAVATPTGAAAAPGSAPAVCRGCGALVARERSTCFVCNTPYDQVRPLARHPAGLLFVRVLGSDHLCRQCNLRSPVSRLDLGSELDCQRCGASQAFDNQQWVEALDFMHLAAEVAQGEVPDPFARGTGGAFDAAGALGFLAHGNATSVGRELDGAASTWTGKEPGAYQLRASPGTPLCDKCHAPLAVTLGDDGTLTAECAPCGQRAAYALPASVAPLAGGLIGVIGEDHRAGHVVARSANALGSVALALECPKCNASLPLQRDMRFVTCTYCTTVSLIPPRFMRLPAATVKPFWVVFRGPSRWRRQRDEQRAAEAAAKREEERRAAAAQRVLAADSVPPRTTVERREAQASRDVSGTDAVGGRSGTMTFVVLAIIVVVALLGYWFSR